MSSIASDIYSSLGLTGSSTTTKKEESLGQADFLRLKAQMVRVGDVKTFENFLVPLPAAIDPARYTAVIVWCETFGQFITAAKYR